MIVRQCGYDRSPLPDDIRDRPRILPGLELFWEAWEDLHSCRPEPGARVPWTAVDQWAVRHRLDPETAEALHHHVRRMDLEWLRFVDEEIRRKTGDHGRL